MAIISAETIYMNGRVKTAVAYGASAAVGLISGFFGGGGISKD